MHIIKGGNRVLTAFLFGFALLLTAACEAPLVLDGVQAEKGRTTQRYDLLQAAAGNDDILVVVGARGVVLRSDDSGTTWERHILEGQPSLISVVTCPDGRFVALGFEQQIWVANAQADTWQASTIETQETPQTLACDPAGRIWVGGSFSTIIKTEDFGQTWSEISLDEDLHFTTVQFTDADYGILTGEFGVVVRTEDGGETWEQLTPLPDEFYPQAAHFRNRQTGWVVGLNGTVFATTDGGQSWFRQPTDTTAPLYALTEHSERVFAVGGFGTVLQLVQGPQASWQSIDHQQPIRFYLRGALALDDQRLLTAGGAGALYVIPTG